MEKNAWVKIHADGVLSKDVSKFHELCVVHDNSQSVSNTVHGRCMWHYFESVEDASKFLCDLLKEIPYLMASVGVMNNDQVLREHKMMQRADPHISTNDPK